ncbi:713_t:CDS:2 [Rhizophagus irregularis]|nr:713_t:CDS:2 [Rhizophagus irregularis]
MAPIGIKPSSYERRKYVYKLGVSKDWAYTDVLGKYLTFCISLDDELLLMVPQPVKAVILLFPITENYEKDRKEEAKKIQENGQEVSPNVVFFRQTISNACGTIGLLHTLASNTDVIKIDGPLKSLLDKTKNLTPEERAKVLEDDEGLAEAHQASASSGQTKDGSLYELDGRKPFPINHGKCTDLLKDSAKIIKKFMNRDPDKIEFTVIALSSNQ